MVNTADLINRGLQHVWNPGTQMKDFETCSPLVVEKAKGSYLYTTQGPVIDAISSWWCKSLGHGHPAVLQAMQEQAQQFEHVIAANTTHPALVELAEELANISGNQHMFFASDGATAVEIAMKLAIHAKQIKGETDRNQFIALKNSYHGESLGTMSISDLGRYKQPYAHFGVKCHFIDNIPYVANNQDPLWNNCDTHWQAILPELEAIADKVCAIIVEPLIQGAGGILCYSPDFLRKLFAWAKANDIYFIADEIMTGIGRTGSWLACDHAGITADMTCLSKGLTSGAMPLSCVALSDDIYTLFYAPHNSGKSFLHSNTYSCHAVAVRAALATIKTFREEQILQQANALGQLMLQQMTQLAEQTGKLVNVRGIGAVVAADLVTNNKDRIGQQFYQQALKLGALMRPIGNTIYWLPALNTDKETIGKLAQITLESIESLY